MYATCHDPKIYPHTNFGITTSNYIQMCSGLDLARNETRGQGHIDLEPVGDSPGPKNVFPFCRLHTLKWGLKCLEMTVQLCEYSTKYLQNFHGSSKKIFQFSDLPPTPSPNPPPPQKKMKFKILNKNGPKLRTGERRGDLYTLPPPPPPQKKKKEKKKQKKTAHINV